MVIQNKKRFFIHFIIVIMVVSVISIVYKKSQAAPGWKNLGQAGFSNGAVDEASIAIYECDEKTEQPNQNQTSNEVNNSESLNPSGSFSYSGGGKNAGCVEVYVGFRDLNNGAKMSVMKYNPTNGIWDYVGGRGFTSGKTYHTDLAVNSQNIPYVVFADFTNSEKLTVMKYVQSKNSWEIVGNPILKGQDTSLKFDNNDVPYISFVYGKDPMVLNFDGSDWVPVGKVSGTKYNYREQAFETALFFNSNNVPYVMYTAYSYDYNTGVSGKNIFVKIWDYNNKTWNIVGDKLSIANYSDYLYPSLKLDSNNTPYVSFVSNYLKSSGFWDYNGFVSKFNGSQWVYLGQPVNSEEPLSLVIDSSDKPYLFFQDSLNLSLGLVQKFDNNKWEKFGSYDFPTKGTSIYDNKAIITDSAGNLFNVFKDSANSNKISVMTTSQSFQQSSWQKVGNLGFTPGVANFISLNIDSQNNKYVAFQDYANKAKASVMKFDGTAWGYVGTAGFSSGTASQVSSTIDLNNNLYVAYQDGAIGGKATVKKWDGASWANLGMPGFSTGSVSGTNIKVDTASNLYISYLEGNNTIVKKYNGSTHGWDDLVISSLPQSREVTLDIDSNNVPHVALRDVLNGDKLTVMSYDNSTGTWQLVGPTAGFSTGTVGNLSLAFSSNNVPEVAFSDGSQAGKVTVMYFDGKAWVNLGNPGFSLGRVGFISMGIDTRDQWNNIPYVSFVDYDNSKKISVMKHDPIKGWISVGSTIGPGLYSSLKLDSNGVPFNVFQDASKGNKATLMKFD